MPAVNKTPAQGNDFRVGNAGVSVWGQGANTRPDAEGLPHSSMADSRINTHGPVDTSKISWINRRADW